MNYYKPHLILSSNDENKKIELTGEVINNIQVQKLLGAHIDYKLKLDEHIETLCKKIGKTFHGLLGNFSKDISQSLFKIKIFKYY